MSKSPFFIYPIQARRNQDNSAYLLRRKSGEKWVLVDQILILYSSISYKFGIIAMLSGLVGVPMGSLLAQRLRPRYDRIDPHICAAGLLISGPIFFLGLLVAASSDTWCFTMVFFGEIFLNLTWSIVADILLVRTNNVWLDGANLPASCLKQD